jgi:hypothetical protein
MSDPPPRFVTVCPRAAASITLGLLSFPLCVLAGIPAVVQGLRALRDIRRSPDQLRGRGLALAGIGAGLLGSVVGIAWLTLTVQKVRDAALRTQSI